MKGKHLELVAGIAIGAVLFGGGATYAAGLLAEPSTQTFYLGDQQIQLEAYAINGHNYVKLRDVGQAVDFNVCYDPARNAAIIEPDKPYIGEDVATPTPAPSVQSSEGTDYAAQANPAVFTGAYTRKMYNAMRYAVLHQEEIDAGTYQPVSLGTEAEVDTATALQLSSRIGCGSTQYRIVDAIDGSAVYLYAEHNEEYDDAAAHVGPFLEGISHLSQREQVREMVWYIADRMTYDVKIKALPAQILAQDEIIEGAGNCMTYSYSLWFLCGQAGIPCILLDSYNHQWNMVYVDGEWWHVDPTANKGNIQTMSFQEVVNGTLVEVEKSEAERAAILQSTRDSLPVFYRVIGETSYIDGSVRIDPTYVDEQPERTKFLQELAVPGSTK